jgi:iron complex outermembrane recepter protein
MLKHCLSTLCVVLSFSLFAQTTVQDKADTLPEILVKSAWASDFTPITFKNYDQKALEKNDFGQDLSYLLQNTPSVVVSSDAGTGVGYTGFRIRGSDPTRVNVTINGIPYNDAESQGVYWVDMPDIFSSTESLQIQRGVGTSTSGAGAFGASINLNTNAVQLEKGLELKTSAGSFGTRRLTLKGTTGLHKGFSVDAKISKIHSDGYIERAASDLLSYDVGATWLGKTASLRFNFIDGQERTYQAWNGLPIQYLNTQRTYNTAGTEQAETPYPNQVDDYRQTHYQLFYKQAFSKALVLNVAGFATKGKGFYEEYKANKNLLEYQFKNMDTSNLVQRRWLDNWFYGTTWGLNFNKNKLDATLSGAYTIYDGKHFGEVIWTAKTQPEPLPYRWYQDQGYKTDFNIYGKINYLISSKSLFYIDLQYREVHYNFTGVDQNSSNIAQSVKMPFFNPKLGFSYKINTKIESYVTFGQASREPNRSDFIQSSVQSRPKAETLQNLELGVKYKIKNAYFNTNFYAMNYKNQLVLTGEINDIGAYNRVNVAKSYRVGLELDGGMTWKKLAFNANLTLSQNKILDFNEFIDNWDTGVQEKVTHPSTDIAFSPNMIAGYELKHELSNVVSLSLLGKYVGKQYIDNSQSKLASLPAYWLNDVRLNYDFTLFRTKKASLAFLCANLLDIRYSSNAWTYLFRSPSYNPIADDPYSVGEKTPNTYRQIGLFPQAGRNYTISLKVKL